MGKGCCVPLCDTQGERVQGVPMHHFPLSSSELTAKWISAIDREGYVPKKSSRVCAKHFRPQAFSKKTSQRQRLRSGAVPSIFPSRRAIINDSSLQFSGAPDPITLTLAWDHSYYKVGGPASIKIDAEKKTYADLKRKILRLRKRCERYETKIKHLEEEKLTISEPQSVVQRDMTAWMKLNLSPMAWALFQNERQNVGVPKSVRRYSQDIRSFCLKLQSESPQLYEYFRGIFTLPFHRTIGEWRTSKCKKVKPSSLSTDSIVTVNYKEKISFMELEEDCRTETDASINVSKGNEEEVYFYEELNTTNEVTTGMYEKGIDNVVIEFLK